MEKQHFLPEEFLPFRRKQRSGGVALLVGGVNKRDALCQRKGLGRADARQETGHIAAFHRAGLLGHAHGGNLRQVELPGQLVQHLGQGGGVVEERVALAQAQLPLFDREKALLCANNLSGCTKHGQRGCIVACVDAQRVSAHGSSGSTASASRPFSRATAPNRPLTNW